MFKILVTVAVALYLWYRGCRVKHQDKVTSFDHRRIMAKSKPEQVHIGNLIKVTLLANTVIK